MKSTLRCFLQLSLKCSLPFVLFVSNAFSKGSLELNLYKHLSATDTIHLSESDSLKIRAKLNRPYGNLSSYDSVQVSFVRNLPIGSVQQIMKGQLVGAFVQENTGEPGSMQQVYVRGISNPIFSDYESINSQPQYYINGVPLIQEHPFAYDVQQYKYNRIGYILIYNQ